MINYIIFTKSSGEINNSVTAVADSIDLAYIQLMHPDFDPVLQDFMETTDQVSTISEYVVSGVITARPLFSTVATLNKLVITADNTDSATLGPGLPNPTTVLGLQIPDGGEYTPAITTITDGSLVIKSAVVGQIAFNLRAFPYQDQLYIVEAI